MRRLLVNTAIAAFVWLNDSTKVGAAIDIDDFEDKQVFRSTSFPIDFTWTPDGDMLVAQKEGILLLLEDPDGDFSYDRRSTLIDLRDVICENSERGLGGVQVHPNFGNGDRWIYLFYTFKMHGNCNENGTNGPVNRLSRFEMGNDKKLGNEKVLFNTPSLLKRFHNGGKIEFGKDGNLYVTTGDSGAKADASFNDSNLLGSMIRIRPDGSIPSDNPFKGSDSERCNEKGYSSSKKKCQEIYAMGLRNPFRMAMDPNTPGNKVRYFINDVGASTWEEINEGGDGYAGNNWVTNYGYPRREGPCRHSRTSGCSDQEGYETPIHFYKHASNGGAATGGAFVPNDIGWPSWLHDGYLYSDFVSGKIYLMKDKGGHADLGASPPKSGMDVDVFARFDSIPTMRFGPYKKTQALYYTSVDNGGVMRRITYVGKNENRSPEAKANANPTVVQPGVQVKFSAKGSSDKDGDQLNYEWDFDGDGDTDSTSFEDSYIYQVPGRYKAKLTVYDDKGAKGTTIVEINVGNPPEPVIIDPPEGTTFAVGDVFILSGEASDPDDGDLGVESLAWEVRQHHADHWHPFLTPEEGKGRNNVKILPAPEPEDYKAATNSYLEVILRATDSDGLSTSTSRFIMPKALEIRFESVPSGLEITLDGTPLDTPESATTWEGHNLEVSAPDQVHNGMAYTWDSWSNGQDQSHVLKVPPKEEAPAKLTATFRQTSMGCAQEALLRSGESLLGNEFNQVDDKYIYCQNDGNLVVRYGEPGSPGDVIWQSKTSQHKGTYYCRLQSDANLLIWEGTPTAQADRVRVWKSKSSQTNPQPPYFLASKCNGNGVWIRQGTPNSPGSIIWTSNGAEPNDQTQPETPSPPDPPSNCQPQPLMYNEDKVWSGTWMQKPDTDAFVSLLLNGVFEVRTGTYEKPGPLVWSTPDFGSSDSGYFIKLQSDGNLIIRPGDGTGYVWKSDSDQEGGAQRFVLALNCDSTISIYKFLELFQDKGKQNNLGKEIWTTPTQDGFKVPFHANALDFTEAVEIDMDSDGGTCGRGPVDGKKVENDSECGACTVGWVRSGEELHYAFENDSDRSVDIKLRLSSKSSGKEVYVEIEDVTGAVSIMSRTFETIGGGWDAFENYVVKNVYLPSGSYELKVKFVNGDMNLCAVSVE